MQRYLIKNSNLSFFPEEYNCHKITRKLDGLFNHLLDR